MYATKEDGDYFVEDDCFAEDKKLSLQQHNYADDMSPPPSSSGKKKMEQHSAFTPVSHLSSFAITVPSSTIPLTSPCHSTSGSLLGSQHSKTPPYEIPASKFTPEEFEMERSIQCDEARAEIRDSRMFQRIFDNIKEKSSSASDNEMQKNVGLERLWKSRCANLRGEENEKRRRSFASDEPEIECMEEAVKYRRMEQLEYLPSSSKHCLGLSRRPSQAYLCVHSNNAGPSTTEPSTWSTTSPSYCNKYGYDGKCSVSTPAKDSSNSWSASSATATDASSLFSHSRDSNTDVHLGAEMHFSMDI